MSPPQAPCVKPKIWQQCAGSGVKIPNIHSKVYYFPTGHLEHACSFPNAPILVGNPPSIPCIISAVDLLADPHTDEVFAKLLPTPVTVNGNVQEPPLEVLDQEDNGDEVVSFVKILAQYDSNNGGRAFNVIRQCRAVSETHCHRRSRQGLGVHPLLSWKSQETHAHCWLEFFCEEEETRCWRFSCFPKKLRRKGNCCNPPEHEVRCS